MSEEQKLELPTTTTLLYAVSEDKTYEVVVSDGDNNHSLAIVVSGEVQNIFTDMGPVDGNSFTRDYMWIVDALVNAYNLGRTNGFGDGYCYVPLP